MSLKLGFSNPFDGESHSGIMRGLGAAAVTCTNVHHSRDFWIHIPYATCREVRRSHATLWHPFEKLWYNIS